MLTIQLALRDALEHYTVWKRSKLHVTDTITKVRQTESLQTKYTASNLLLGWKSHCRTDCSSFDLNAHATQVALWHVLCCCRTSWVLQKIVLQSMTLRPKIADTTNKHFVGLLFERSLQIIFGKIGAQLHGWDVIDHAESKSEEKSWKYRTVTKLSKKNWMIFGGFFDLSRSFRRD